MSEADPLACVPLEPGERVLWQGRPGFGAPWAEVRQVLRGAFIVWVSPVVVMGLLGLGTFAAAGPFMDARTAGDLLALVAFVVGWSALVAPFVVTSLLSRFVGPYFVSILALLVLGPLLLLRWAALALRGGWEGAVANLGPGDFVAGLLLLAPLVRIVAGVLGRVNARYVLTDRRAAEVSVSGGAPRLVWTAPLVGRTGRLEARVVWPWGWRRRGHLAVGYGHHRRLMTMLQAPDAVLAEVKRALGERRAPRSEVVVADDRAPGTEADPEPDAPGDVPDDERPRDRPATPPLGA